MPTLPRATGGSTGAVGLVVNVLVLWHTRFMEAALSHLRATGVQIEPEDVAGSRR
jgi:TnpA family transposase